MSQWRCRATAATNCSAVYNRHVWGGDLQARLGKTPAPLRRMLSLLLSAVSPEPADTIARLACPLLPARFNFRRAGDQIAKLARIVGAESPDQLYRSLCSIDDDPSHTVLQGEERGPGRTRRWQA